MEPGKPDHKPDQLADSVAASAPRARTVGAHLEFGVLVAGVIGARMETHRNYLEALFSRKRIQTYPIG
jgi:hypothetical protein